MHMRDRSGCLLTQKVVLITLKEFLACVAKASLQMFNQRISDNQTNWRIQYREVTGPVHCIVPCLLVKELRYT